MQLFQLMEWFDLNNYDDDLYPIITDIPDDINPFEPPPNDYKGDAEVWYKELDILMNWVKIEYVSVCEQIWQVKNGGKAWEKS